MQNTNIVVDVSGIIGGTLPERRFFRRQPVAKVALNKPCAKAKHRRTRFDKSPMERRMMKVTRQGKIDEGAIAKADNRVKNEIISDLVSINQPVYVSLLNRHTDMAMLSEAGYDIEVSSNKVSYLCNEANAHKIRRLVGA